MNLTRLRALILSLAASVAAMLGLSAIPAASADTCAVTATDTATGATQVFQGVQVPTGDTDPSDILAALVQGGFVTPGQIDLSSTTLTDSCAPGTTTTTTSTTATSSTTSSTSTAPPATTTTVTAPPAPTTPAGSTTTTITTTTSTTTTGRGSGTSTTTTIRAPKPPTSTSTTTATTGTGSSSARPSGSAPEPSSSRTTSTASSSRAKQTKTKTVKRRTTRTATTTGNPLLKAMANGSFKLDSTTTTVPDFFIESFQIPPFLLPIYQAAGIEYQVPWSVLAAINQIETDYGRDLSVSSAGAVGWMQFMPSTWQRYGVDATGNGVADPYNPVDAIFSAARYLHAAGASTNLYRAILAYNHAGWYVESVLLRAKLIAGIPNQLTNSLSDLVEGRFPVAAHARYAEDAVVADARHRARTLKASTAVESDGSRGTAIFAHRNAPVIAVNDGKIVALGHSAALGRYIRLQDATGNTYTYAHLGRISKLYASPKPVRITAHDLAQELSVPKVKAPTQAASAGRQGTLGVSGTTLTPTRELTSLPRTRTGHAATAVHWVTSTTSTTSTTPTTRTPSSAARRTAAHHSAHRSRAAAGVVKERLFAHPARRASWAAGGKLQLHSTSTISSFGNYFSDTTLHLARNQYTLRRLRMGSIVVAGTILGRVGGRSQGAASHLWFQIQPAGRRSPDIDPKPILDGWKLLQATDIYRAKDVDAFYSPDARNPSVGQVLLMSKQQLIERVLSDPHVHIYACGRRDVAAGLVDRRVLAALEFLADSGLHPTVSGLVCGAGSRNIDGTGKTGESVDISAINGTPVSAHQGPGSITAETIRRLLSLQGLMAPDDIVSDTRFRGQSTVLALPDHTDRIQISYTPYYGADRKQSAEAGAYLKPGQWTKLINQIGTISEPSVPITPSKYAIKR